MKKKLWIGLMALLTCFVCSAAVACGENGNDSGGNNVINSITSTDSSDVNTGSSDVNTGSSDVNTDSSDVNTGSSDINTDSSDINTDSSDVNTDSSDNTTDSSDTSTENPDTDVEIGFTAEEKALFNGYFGFVIPFADGKYPMVSDYTKDSANYCSANVNFSVELSSREAVDAYIALYTKQDGYVSKTMEVDGEFTRYSFRKNGASIVITCNAFDSSYFLIVQVTLPYGGAVIDFTAAEKEMMEKYCGFVIPFIQNDLYSVTDYLNVVEFYTFGNTEEDFNDYVALLRAQNDYAYVGEKADEDGITWHYFTCKGCTVKVAYYNPYGSYMLKVKVEKGTDHGFEDDVHTGIDFTNQEKTLLNDYFGFLIPFMPSDNYSVTDRSSENTGLYDAYVWYSVFVESEASLDEYRALLSVEDGYTYEGEEEKYGGGTIYVYSKNNVTVEVTITSMSGMHLLSVYAKIEKEFTGIGGKFTTAEKDTMNSRLGFVLPFAEGKMYAFTDITDEISEYYSVFVGVIFYGCTEADFETYKALLSTEKGYTYVENYQDDYGNDCYVYSKNGVTVKITYQADRGFLSVDAYIEAETSGFINVNLG